MSMSTRPRKKAPVPLAFCLRAKKSNVFCGPMMMVKPMRKRIYSYIYVSSGPFDRGSSKAGYLVHFP